MNEQFDVAVRLEKEAAEVRKNALVAGEGVRAEYLEEQRLAREQSESWQHEQEQRSLEWERHKQVQRKKDAERRTLRLKTASDPAVFAKTTDHAEALAINKHIDKANILLQRAAALEEKAIREVPLLRQKAARVKDQVFFEAGEVRRRYFDRRKNPDDAVADQLEANTIKRLSDRVIELNDRADALELEARVEPPKLRAQAALLQSESSRVGEQARAQFLKAEKNLLAKSEQGIKQHLAKNSPNPENQAIIEHFKKDEWVEITAVLKDVVYQLEENFARIALEQGYDLVGSLKPEKPSDRIRAALEKVFKNGLKDYGLLEGPVTF